MTGSPDAARPPLELWGGLECTIVRLEHAVRDQIVETGHCARPDDLDAIAALGIKTLRYPVLWETISPETPDEADFSWHDGQLNRLRTLGIAPIAGLVHHGSGPRYTDLLDPSFPELLARHAGRVAARYPWIERFTPVNEPLTTARFSGLYGHWYPHARDTRSFIRMVVNQCRATALAMAAVRAVTPGAQLLQTEDLGKTFSTPLLGYQADYENERRWLSFDLLLGRVGRHHPLYEEIRACGVGEGELGFFLDNPCPPDVLGINHYLTSERFLDHRPGSAPAPHTGGNGRHRYADLEAVRADLPPGTTGPEARLREAWSRYGLPMAVTEVHHGCTRDEQLRWMQEVWEAATTLRAEGADLRAVTVWALFGAVDWNSLLSRKDGHYEPGAYDVRSSPPRLTALGAATASLAKEGRFNHPVLDVAGWWHREERFDRRPAGVPGVVEVPGHARKLLITGAQGALSCAVARIAHSRGLAHTALSHRELDSADPGAVERALKRRRPWAVIDASGAIRADQEGGGTLSQACAAAGIPLVTFSSDPVFAGRSGAPYRESDGCVLAANPGALLVRTGTLFGPWDSGNFVVETLRDLAAGRSVRAAADRRVSPTYLPDLVHAALDLLIDGERGVWHLANQGDISWYDLARKAAEMAGLDPSRLEPEGDATCATTTALTSEQGLLLPSLESALARFLTDGEHDWREKLRIIAAE